MKKLICLITYFVATLLILLPSQVFAAGGVDVDTTSVTVVQGESSTFNIIATNAASQLIFSTSNSGIISIDNKPDWIENERMSIKVNGLAVGTSTISIKVNAATFDEEVIQKTIKVNVNVIPPKSSNTNLASIKINDIELGNFNSSTLSYNLQNTDDSSIKVTATAADSTATIVGTGTQQLSYGVNTINIVVTAENGEQKTYTLKVIRNDKRSSENSLSSLTISHGNIKFDSNKTDYTVTVDKNVTQLEVIAKAKDSRAVVTGGGLIKLTGNTNEINIVVTAENGSKKTYKIKVIKNNQQESSPERLPEGSQDGAPEVMPEGSQDGVPEVMPESLSANNRLNQLVVYGYNINFDSDKEIYYLNVTESVNKIMIDAICEDEKATVLIKNLDNLEIGENIIDIEITAENGDVKTYKIIVNKNSNEIKDNDSWIYKNKSIIGIAIIILIVIIIIFILLLKKKKKKEAES